MSRWLSRFVTTCLEIGFSFLQINYTVLARISAWWICEPQLFQLWVSGTTNSRRQYIYIIFTHRLLKVGSFPVEMAETGAWEGQNDATGGYASSHLLAQMPLFLQNENHAVIVNPSPCLSSSTFPHWHDMLFSSSVLSVCHLTSFLPVCHLTSFLTVCHLTSFLPVCHLTSFFPVCHLTSFLPVCHLTSFLPVCHHPSSLPVRFTEQVQKVPHVLTQVYSIFHCAVYRLSLIHIWRCRRDVLCRSRWSAYH